ncbi:hypothetical protein NDU88_003045 [Pleurodeles waltl]|uniref:Uncharacterized protein n=1 Tax=Pleurodeles waltl TaxID=8319 RepID=A0AAV7SEN5_PLEWA|nr:hypothetical protein NDU88_003045 [Pleurodeles waltl]
MQVGKSRTEPEGQTWGGHKTTPRGSKHLHSWPIPLAEKDIRLPAEEDPANNQRDICTEDTEAERPSTIQPLLANPKQSDRGAPMTDPGDKETTGETKPMEPPEEETHGAGHAGTT